MSRGVWIFITYYVRYDLRFAFWSRLSSLVLPFVRRNTTNPNPFLISKRLIYAKLSYVITHSKCMILRPIVSHQVPLLSWTLHSGAHSLTTAAWDAMRGRGKPASRTMSYMGSHGPQLAPLVLLLLYDQYYKAWCHGGHGTSCRSPCVNTVLKAHALTHRRGGFDEGLWMANFA